MDDNGDITVMVRFKCAPEDVSDMVAAWLDEEFVNVTFAKRSGEVKVITTALTYVKEQA